MFVCWFGVQVENYVAVSSNDEGVKEADLFLRIFNCEFNCFMKAIAVSVKHLSSEREPVQMRKMLQYILGIRKACMEPFLKSWSLVHP